jgi:ABC-2 family transporter
MSAESISQILSVMRLELRKTFFARRGLWIYVLAFAPVALFFFNSAYAAREKTRLALIEAGHPISKEALKALQIGQSRDSVLAALGEPYRKFNRRLRFGPPNAEQVIERDIFRYTDGEVDVTLNFENSGLRFINRTEPMDLAKSGRLFAGVFQLYYVRLAIFFGCVGVFMNLFRGEMLDKSLHFYLLSPMSRDVLLTAKYLAGLIATIVIFSISTALQFWSMLRQFDSATTSSYLQDGGWHHLAAYLGVTALACIGYGSVFLTAGLLFRNPIIPAAVVLLWESANLFVPVTLKKISLIFYLQSLCPIAAPVDPNMTPLLSILISTAEPASNVLSIAAILIITFVMLQTASLKARRLEINYSTD